MSILGDRIFCGTMKCSHFILTSKVHPCLQRQLISSLKSRSEPLPQSAILHKSFQRQRLSGCLVRCFSSFKKPPKESPEDKKYKAQIKELNKKGQDLEENKSIETNQIDDKIGIAKEKQARTPWHREGLESPPVRKSRSTGAMAKGILSIISSPRQRQRVNTYPRQAFDHPF